MNELGSVTHRVVTICWLPREPAEWETFSNSRREAAELWNRMARIHAFCRARRWPWPGKKSFRRWAQVSRKRLFPDLNSQSIQEIIDEFLEAVESARSLRKKGHTEARYPRAGRGSFRDVPYKNNQARFRDGCVVLPNGASGDLRVPLPRGMMADELTLSVYRGSAATLTGRLQEARLSFGKLHLVLRVSIFATKEEEHSPIGVDLGVNTLIAATDGERSLLISGRPAKSLVRYRNKKLGDYQKLLSQRVRGSRRWKKTRRSQRQFLGKVDRRMNDLFHKATRQVADFFPGRRAYVGRPFNDAAARKGSSRKGSEELPTTGK